MQKPLNITITQGRPLPFGVSTDGQAFNFSLTSNQAKSVTLCLFDRETKELIFKTPYSVEKNKTGAVWHAAISGIEDPQNILYAYEINLAENFLLDPFAKSVATGIKWGHTLGETYAPFGELPIFTSFDWENDEAPKIPLQDLIIYEMHTRGFTQDPSSRAKHPGTFLGIIEKIPHLLKLGINAVELLPVQEFDENEYKRFHPNVKTSLYNFWGYSTVNYFTPMSRYATKDETGAPILEFKQMVKELHKNGIEVILDVVFNHTAEGGATGPTLSFKGIDNDLYYMMENNHYLNFTGCGNTVNGNQTITLEMIITCLRYWVIEMHVDGFRFDLASIFSRDRFGHPLQNTAIIKAITDDPILSSIKLIAEPWDATGLYQVGTFAGRSPKWSEWNDKFRDCVRRFIKGMPGTNGDFARRISGSEDLYHDRTPLASINFITAHDGFTLADLVSYNTKHNLDNGENNADGNSHNESWNCGVEGETDAPSVLTIRQKQMRNFHLALMLSQGIPMLHMGDEYGHTKNGNNNTWCQDNSLNWFLWDQLQENRFDYFTRFYIGLIKFRKNHSILKRSNFLTDNDIDWHGIEPMKADWKGEHAFIAFTLKDHENQNDLYAAFNAQEKEVLITLPNPPIGKEWKLIVNTANPSPQDLYDEDEAPVLDKKNLYLPAYSAILLKALE